MADMNEAIVQKCPIVFRKRMTKFVIFMWIIVIIHAAGVSFLPFDVYAFIPDFGFVKDANIMLAYSTYNKYSSAYIEISSISLFLFIIIVMQSIYIILRYLIGLIINKKYKIKYIINLCLMSAINGYISFYPNHSNFFDTWPKLSLLPVPVIIMMLNIYWPIAFYVISWDILFPNDFKEKSKM